MIKRKKKSQEEIDNGKEETKKMWDFFLSIWKVRPHYSEISGTFLGYEAKTTYFHHILKSRKYEEAKYDPENIILLTWEEHQVAEHYPERFPEIMKRLENLKKKYNIE